VTLTTAGRRAALTTIRRHRVIEAYLAIALGYPWDRVHAEAEHLEHAASDELVDRMAAAIGEPLTDPHGAPIPTREGLMDERRHRALHDLPMGEVALVASVSDRDPEQLRHLADLEIRPGASLTVIARAPLNGPLTIAVSHGPGKPPRRHDVGAVLAQQVFVEAAPPRRRPRKSL
jgi:DtxR family Mn-dependent transcriptional regulator